MAEYHDLEETFQRLRKDLLERIDKEIKDHPNWCGPNCDTFLKQVYRDRRLKGDSAKSLQNDYDSCHIFR